MNDRKVYTSFYDMPFSREDYSDSSIHPSGIKFSSQEIIHIIISMGVLTLAFSFAFAPYPPLSNLNEVIGYLPLSFLAIATAFFCHEIAHKFIGQKFGYWSEFRMYPQGLLFALILGVLAGFVFAAPGAVQIFGRPNKEDMGKISVAGPSINILLSGIFAIIWYVSNGIIASVAFFIAYINMFLAFFNLLPFGPLDGAKIIRWRIEIWGFLIVINILLLFILF